MHYYQLNVSVDEQMDVNADVDVDGVYVNDVMYTDEFGDRERLLYGCVWDMEGQAGLLLIVYAMDY